MYQTCAVVLLVPHPMRVAVPCCDDMEALLSPEDTSSWTLLALARLGAWMILTLDPAADCRAWGMDWAILAPAYALPSLYKPQTPIRFDDSS